jgi:hypothetical protein
MAFACARAAATAIEFVGDEHHCFLTSTDCFFLHGPRELLLGIPLVPEAEAADALAPQFSR